MRSSNQPQTAARNEIEITRAVETLNTPNSGLIVAEEPVRVDEDYYEKQEPSNKEPMPPPDSDKAESNTTRVKNKGMKLSTFLLMVVALVSIGANIWLGV